MITHLLFDNWLWGDNCLASGVLTLYFHFHRLLAFHICFVVLGTFSLLISIGCDSTWIGFGLIFSGCYGMVTCYGIDEMGCGGTEIFWGETAIICGSWSEAESCMSILSMLRSLISFPNEGFPPETPSKKLHVLAMGLEISPFLELLFWLVSWQNEKLIFFDFFWI